MEGQCSIIGRCLTILRSSPSPEADRKDAQVLALAALGWTLEDENRAERFLSLTGLDADTLRGGLGDPVMLAAVLDFLANHEPDLIRAAEALAITPEELVAASQELRA